jgi:hypothetical protein
MSCTLWQVWKEQIKENYIKEEPRDLLFASHLFLYKGWEVPVQDSGRKLVV